MQRKINENWHTHTSRCKHARGKVDDYVEQARLSGLKVLGMSDHTPLPDHRWPQVRMEMGELEDYCREVRRAEQKYSDIQIHLGMECEDISLYKSFYKEKLLDELKLDYLVGAVHYLPFSDGWKSVYGNVVSHYDLRLYVDYLIQTMESGLFLFIAHPDLFANSYLNWDSEAISASRDILSAAHHFNLPLEINGYGLRKRQVLSPTGTRPMYPWEKFWELAAEFDVKVVCNSDAHKPGDVAASLEQCNIIAEKFGLNRIELSEFFAQASSTQ